MKKGLKNVAKASLGAVIIVMTAITIYAAASGVLAEELERRRRSYKRYVSL
jgi:hypothetical protein